MTQSQTEPVSHPEQGSEIVARYGREYRVKRYLIVLMCLVMGGWFLWDGFHKWPAENAAARAAGQNEPHPGYDVPLNRGLGIVMPILGVLMLAWTHHNSRGTCRLSGTTLYIPGHPPIPLEAIRKIDKRLWDRKGIACIDYELPDSPQQRQFKLDDFVYDREPIDRIFECIEEYVAASLQQDEPGSSNNQ